MPVPDHIVQGNVLKAFRRKNARYLFVRFHDGDQLRVRAGFREILLADELITTARRQAKLQDTHERFAMFGLSATGYDRLGLADAAPADPTLGARQFARGMRVRNGAGAADTEDYYLWDPDVDAWDREYRDNEIDAFLLLADDDPVRLSGTAAALQPALKRIGSIVAEEQGYVLEQPGKDWPIEHYGFREGVASVPMKDREAVFTPERLPGTGASAEYGLGCFAAFVKLEQNVRKFDDDCKELAAQANRNASNSHRVTAERISELAVGRQRNGEPLVSRGRNQNEFEFSGVNESVCPYHAHIRVMNERDGPPMPQILRRGMSYGPKRMDLEQPGNGHLPPQSGSGLLFLSFQRSLWDFIALIAKGQKGLDPMLTRSSRWQKHQLPEIAHRTGRRGQKWIIGGREICYPLADLTTIRGGAYFYIPSMRFIDRLDQVPRSAATRIYASSRQGSAQYA